MSRSSLMMMGSNMNIETDDKKGQQLDSEIRLTGKFLGLDLFVRESVVQLDAPFKKTWKTRGEQNLIVIEQYTMGFLIAPQGSFSHLEVFIDYSLPPKGVKYFLGRLLGHLYVKWCIQKMIQEASDRFFVDKIAIQTKLK